MHEKALAALQAQVEEIGRKIDIILNGLHGPLGEPEKGLIVKVDRLRQVERSRAKVLWAGAVAVIGLICKQLWSAVGW